MRLMVLVLLGLVPSLAFAADDPLAKLRPVPDKRVWTPPAAQPPATRVPYPGQRAFTPAPSSVPVPKPKTTP